MGPLFRNYDYEGGASNETQHECDEETDVNKRCRPTLSMAGHVCRKLTPAGLYVVARTTERNTNVWFCGRSALGVLFLFMRGTQRRRRCSIGNTQRGQSRHPPAGCERALGENACCEPLRAARLSRDIIAVGGHAT